jgi:hypothetical protein
MAVARTWARVTTLVVAPRASDLVTPESLHALASDPRVDGRRAEQELGHRPRPLGETIGDLYRWFDAQSTTGRAGRWPLPEQESGPATRDSRPMALAERDLPVQTAVDRAVPIESRAGAWRQRMATPSRRRDLMRRMVLTLALGAALATAAPVGAITFGSADADGHPYVGGLVSPTQYSDGTWIACSGTLISPKVFLTAAHCGDEGERVAVTFDMAYMAGDLTYAGVFHADPLFPGSTSDMHDIAVVVLDKAVKGITPARLPAAGSLTDLPHDQLFTSVGYGAYEVTNEPGGHRYLYDDVRMVATGTLNSTNKTLLRISMNPSLGNGGTCYGDSGGPNFLGTTDIVAAITITGDAICRSTNVDYRMDTASARAFLAGFVALP